MEKHLGEAEYSSNPLANKVVSSTQIQIMKEFNIFFLLCKIDPVMTQCSYTIIYLSPKEVNQKQKSIYQS
jgi:hypothetical protein